MDSVTKAATVKSGGNGKVKIDLLDLVRKCSDYMHQTVLFDAVISTLARPDKDSKEKVTGFMSTTAGYLCAEIKVNPEIAVSLRDRYAHQLCEINLEIEGTVIGIEKGVFMPIIDIIRWKPLEL